MNSNHPFDFSSAKQPYDTLADLIADQKHPDYKQPKTQVHVAERLAATMASGRDLGIQLRVDGRMITGGDKP
jgi:hypothetical protein